MSQDRLRLFVALELAEQAREALLRWRAEVLPGQAGLRLTAREHLHVTLCFLGSRPAADVDTIAAACAAAIGAAGPAELELGRAIWLPPRRPRVLAVELLDSNGALGAWQAALVERLERGGSYEPERRPFRPHVTVARVPRGVRAPPGTLPSPEAVRFAAQSVTLFCSRLSRSGARYEPLGRFSA